MKKQLLTLTLLSLGYIASSHGAGVAVMAQVTKLKTNVVAGSTQKVNAKAMWIEEETPDVPGQIVLELEEKKPNEWIVTHKNPGTAVLHIKKKRPGYSETHAKGHHKCKGAKITVKGKKGMSTKVRMDENMVAMKLEQGATHIINASKVYLDPNSAKGIVSIKKTGNREWTVKAHKKSGTVMVLSKDNENDDPVSQQFRVVKPQ